MISHPFFNTFIYTSVDTSIMQMNLQKERDNVIEEESGCCKGREE